MNNYNTDAKPLTSTYVYNHKVQFFTQYIVHKFAQTISNAYEVSRVENVTVYWVRNKRIKNTVNWPRMKIVCMYNYNDGDRTIHSAQRRTTTGVYNSVTGDEAPWRTFIYKTWTSKIKKTAANFVENWYAITNNG